MQHWKGSSLILLALCAAAALVAGPAPLAGDKDDGRVPRSTVRISVVDDEGNRHEETFEFDDEHPRPYLGVQLESVDGGGARVERVLEGSAAERAGLREGDVIVRFEGEPVESSWDLTRRVWRSDVGQRVNLEVERDGRTESVAVELGRHEGRGGGFGNEGFEVPGFDHLGEMFDFQFDTEELEERLQEMERQLGDMKFDFDFDFDRLGKHGAFVLGSRRPALGVELVDVTPELREHLGGDPDTGVLVGRVLPGTPAEAAGVRVGDLLVKVEGEAIADVGDLRRALDERRGRSFSIEVLRDGRSVSFDVTLPSRDEDVEETPESSRPRLTPARRLGAADRT